jgi:hypothetical protein
MTNEQYLFDWRDLGTSATKVALYRPDGTLVLEASAEVCEILKLAVERRVGLESVEQA